MIAISWDHWRPATWPRLFPFEVFLFFFLVLTGYLITGSLLRERDRKEPLGRPWKWEGLKNYQIRRGLRILAPYYAALALALIVQAPDAWMGREADAWTGFSWYALHLSNFHMAVLGDWPGGTNHFWSLAIQQQFYLIWPLVIWFAPRKWLLPTMLVFSLIGPVSRHYSDFFLTWFKDPGLLTWSAFDYFGIGGLLALAVHRGMSLESPALRWLALTGLAGYIGIFGSHEMGWPTYGLRPVQQTCLAIALCGFIAAGSVGFRGPVGRILETAALQRIGQVSYGIYLFHNLAPLVVGKLFWFLWFGPFDSWWGEVIRIPIYAAATWALTMASWRWIETPLQEVRAKIGAK